MGRIAGMLGTTRDEATPLQRELDRTGRMLGIVVVAIAVVMIATIVVVEEVRDPAGLVDVLILGVALAVAAVPEGLPAVVTAVLAIGVQRMARRRAIVRHLAAVETLGSASIIASDKTGTLTRNEMTVREVVTASGHVTFGGTVRATGDVTGAGGADRRRLSHELERALAAADARQCGGAERDGRWKAAGRPAGARSLVVRAREGVARTASTSACRASASAFSQRKAHEHRASELGTTSASSFLEGGARRLLARARNGCFFF